MTDKLFVIDITFNLGTDASKWSDYDSTYLPDYARKEDVGEEDELLEVLSEAIRALELYLSREGYKSDLRRNKSSGNRLNLDWTFEFKKIEELAQQKNVSTDNIITDIINRVKLLFSEILENSFTKKPDIPAKVDYKIVFDNFDRGVNTYFGDSNAGGYRLLYRTSGGPAPLPPPPPTTPEQNVSTNQQGEKVEVISPVHQPNGPTVSTVDDINISATQAVVTQPTQTPVSTQSGTVSTDSTAIPQDKSRGDIQGQEASTSNPSTQKVDEIKKNIIQIVEPKLKASVIEVTIPPGEQSKKEYAETIAIVPFVWYGSYQIEYDDIEFLQLYTVSNIPTLKLVFKDTLNLMKDSSFPLDDSLITIFINPRSVQLKPIHLDFKITNFSNNKRTYTITGSLDANQLYVKKFKSFSNKTSYEALKDISQEVGLGFASNIDDTNDKMIWICPGQRYVEFIESIVNNSYKSDETYLSAYIDFHYNLTYVDVEKENSRNIKEEIGIGNAGIGNLVKEKKELVGKLFLTNDQGFRETNSYFFDYRIMNNSSSISLSEGYSTTIKYYDELKKEFLVFDIETLTSSEEDKIILKGRPKDEEFYNQNKEVVYLGKLDEDNMFRDYHYSYIQNYRNLVELAKISIEVSMLSPNYNLYRYQKVLVLLSNQASNITNSHINNRLSGEWLIVDIMYRFESGKYTQIIKLVKRELELGPDEQAADVGQKKKRDTGRGTSENPVTETPSQSSDTTLQDSVSAPETDPGVTVETSNMQFSVPPPPQKETKSSPSGFPVKSTSFKKTERKPTQIILHYTAGWQVLDKGAGTVDFLMNGRKDYPTGLSYHYIISVDGHIENLVDPKYIASHSGDPCNNLSIGISLASLGTTFDYLGMEGAKQQIDKLRKSTNKNTLATYGKNEDYAKLVDFDGKEKKYRNFTACQEVSVAQIGALEALLKSLKNRFPTLPSYSGLTKESYDILFPELGAKSGSFGCPSWKKDVPGIYTHCSITKGKVDIAPTPRLINFFRRLRL